MTNESEVLKDDADTYVKPYPRFLAWLILLGIVVAIIGFVGIFVCPKDYQISIFFPLAVVIGLLITTNAWVLQKIHRYGVSNDFATE